MRSSSWRPCHGATSLITDPHGRSALLFVDFAALAGGLGFLILGRLPWPWLKRWWGTHHLHACSVIANRVIFSRERGPKIAALSLLVHVLAVVIAWCVVQSIAAPVVFGQIFQLVPPVMLITMLPISIAGWGVREATMGLAFGYAGLMSSEGVNVSLLFGAVSFIVGAFGGLVWIFSAEKAAKGAAPIEVPELECTFGRKPHAVLQPDQPEPAMRSARPMFLTGCIRSQ